MHGDGLSSSLPACRAGLLRAIAFFFMIDATSGIKETVMWYFSWTLGIGAALGFGIINVMWLEANGVFARDSQHAAARAKDLAS
jgi:cyd operon protein YbgT